MCREFFHKLPANLAACFWGINLLWLLLAIVLTYVLVISGFDWWYYQITRSPKLNGLALAAGGAGFVIPVVVPVGMYLAGRRRSSTPLIHAGAAAGQSVVLASIITSTFKAFTGRLQPVVTYYLAAPSEIDNSGEFYFGVLRNGIFWGWPSSHTAVAFAAMAALVLVSPNTAVRIVAFLFACFIAAGASVGFHWISDVAAGVIVGSLIGVVVGKSFQSRMMAEPAAR